MPAGAAAAAGAVPVAGAEAGGGAGVVAVVAVGGADDDVAGAGSFFEQARSATAMRRADAIDLLMPQSKLLASHETRLRHRRARRHPQSPPRRRGGHSDL